MFDELHNNVSITHAKEKNVLHITIKINNNLPFIILLIFHLIVNSSTIFNKYILKEELMNFRRQLWHIALKRNRKFMLNVNIVGGWSDYSLFSDNWPWNLHSLLILLELDQPWVFYFPVQKWLKNLNVNWIHVPILYYK